MHMKSSSMFSMYPKHATKHFYLWLAEPISSGVAIFRNVQKVQLANLRQEQLHCGETCQAITS